MRLSNSGQKLLLTGRAAEAQAGHNDSGFRDGELPRYFSMVTSKVIGHLCINLGLNLAVQYSGVQKKVLRKAFVREEENISPTSVFPGHKYAQNASSEWHRGLQRKSRRKKVAREW